MPDAAQTAVRLAERRTRADLDADITLRLSLWKLLAAATENR